MPVVPKVKGRCGLHNYLKGKQASQTVKGHKSNITNCLASLLEAQAREGGLDLFLKVACASKKQPLLISKDKATVCLLEGNRTNITFGSTGKGGDTRPFPKKLLVPSKKRILPS